MRYNTILYTTHVYISGVFRIFLRGGWYELKNIKLIQDEIELDKNKIFFEKNENNH